MKQQTMYETNDLHVLETRALMSPRELAQDLPVSERAAQTVYATRENVKRILRGEDHRLIVVVGPCSIHDVDAAREFATRLLPLTTRLSDRLCIIMRVYFEKPRTTIGWKGLINDPGLDDSFRINDGLHLARRLLLDLNELGIPCGTEFLDPITPAYIAELVSWGAIGARTTESQTHRELASGLSCPVGFKNGTDGSVQIAVDAIRAAAHRHHFLGVTIDGQSAIIATGGNPDCHVILRGANRGPNYAPEHLDAAARMLQQAGLRPNLMIDCSHANSSKDHTRQTVVARALGEEITGGEDRLIGVMLEGHLNAGRRDLKPGKKPAYGYSITDACMGWDDVAATLNELHTSALTRGR